MKKIAFFVCIVLAYTINAQVEKYHRVLIKVAPEKKQSLMNLGITVDHSHTSLQGIEAEISDYEISLLKGAAIPYEVLINDMTKYYQERNKTMPSHKEANLYNCNLTNVPVPSHFHHGSMGGFFTLSEMENILDSMNLLYPNLISAKQAISSTQTTEGRNIWYVRISDNPGVDENEPEVLYTALHHAREPQSLSQLIFYMWHLLENYATDPDIKATLDNRELYFVPCVNPDGYVYNQTNNPSGGGMWRKNRRQNSDGSFGVDLNRNYGQDWGYDNIGSSPTPSTDVYRGATAFSEPETQAMQNFCNSHQFKNALNAHTFGNDLIYPWGHIPSSYTPDNSLFEAWGEYLTRDHRYVYGTCNETLGYLTNGDCDSWMYGEQTSKGKIIAMTPETGTFNDGFWPASYRIVDICKTTLTQNYKLAKLAGNHQAVLDMQDKFISGNGYIKYKVQRLGLSAGSATVSVIPVGAGLSSASLGAPKVYSSLTQNQEILDSIAYTLQPGLTAGQYVKYSLAINNDGANYYQLITKIYGTPQTIFSDNGSSATANFDQVANWGTSSAEFVSPPSSITESPLGNYNSDNHKIISTKGQLSLSSALAAHLQYYTKFVIEKTFDQATIEVSTDNGATYSALCGIYQTPPATFDGTDPVYDGRQDNWVKEDIDLAAYLGQKIKLRFKFDADFFDERDGFYFDDFLVRIITTSGSVGLTETTAPGDISLFPNPSKGSFKILGEKLDAAQITIYNSLGQATNSAVLQSTPSELSVDVESYPAGIYFVKIRTNGQEIAKKLVLEPR